MNKPYPFRRTRVKICGLTRPEDAVAAVRMGADAIGLVFYPPSPRYVGADAARAIVTALPPFATVVGLFVDAEPAEVRQVLNAVPLDLLQFHGDEPAGYCEGFGRPYLKALRMRPGVDLVQFGEEYPAAQGWLLDAWHPDTKGGTGEGFDWNRIPPSWSERLVLAGGLDADNVTAALATARPYAVDVSSGVESAKGIKDTVKMASFLREVYEFDHRHAAG